MRFSSASCNPAIHPYIRVEPATVERQHAAYSRPSALLLALLAVSAPVLVEGGNELIEVDGSIALLPLTRVDNLFQPCCAHDVTKLDGLSQAILQTRRNFETICQHSSVIPPCDRLCPRKHGKCLKAFSRFKLTCCKLTKLFASKAMNNDAQSLSNSYWIWSAYAADGKLAAACACQSKCSSTS